LLHVDNSCGHTVKARRFRAHIYIYIFQGGSGTHEPPPPLQWQHLGHPLCALFRRPEGYILAVYTAQAWSTSSRVLSLEPLRPVVTSYTTQPTQNTIISLMCYFYKRNSSAEIRHYFPCFCKKERKLQPIWPNNEKKHIGPKSIPNCYFHNSVFVMVCMYDEHS